MGNELVRLTYVYRYLQYFRVYLSISVLFQARTLVVHVNWIRCYNFLLKFLGQNINNEVKLLKMKFNFNDSTMKTHLGWANGRRVKEHL